MTPQQHQLYMWYRNLVTVELDRFFSVPSAEKAELVAKALDTYLRGAKAKAFIPPNYVNLER